MTTEQFQSLLSDLAIGWRARDYVAVASRFASDVRYSDPTRYALRGREALLDFFSADDGHAQQMEWHLTLFDEAQQLGAAEYTYEGTHRYHGVVLIRVADGVITHWREYQHVSGVSWAEFTADSSFRE